MRAYCYNWQKFLQTLLPFFTWLLKVSFWHLQIAITGKSFFTSSSIAADLIMNNILKIGRLNVIGDVILFLGKLCVSLSCALFAFLMLETHKYRSALNKTSSPLLPVVVCFLCSRVINTQFNNYT